MSQNHSADEQAADRFMQMAVPLRASDFTPDGNLGGAFGRFVDMVRARRGFRDKPLSDVQRIVAQAFGYADYESLRARRARATATKAQDFPNRVFELAMFLAWRAYLAGSGELLDAYMAFLYAWERSSLWAVRTFYADNHLGRHAGFSARGRRESLVVIPEGQAPHNAELTDEGLLRCNHRYELLQSLAQQCWTATSGVTADELVHERETGCLLSVEDAIEESWYSHEVWPLGLWPVQFEDAHGKLVGWGWRWEEMHRYLARVFSTPEDFAASAAALWRRQSTKPYACTSLPEMLRVVDFVNPLANRQQAQASPEQDRLDDVVMTRGGELLCADTVDMDGEPWTGTPVELAVTEFNTCMAYFALERPREDAVAKIREDVDWLEGRIPGVISRKNFEALCEAMALLDTLEHSRSASADLTKEELEAVSWSVRGSKPSVSAASRGILASMDEALETSGAGRAGRTMQAVYPELSSMGELRLGELALALYGKDDIRTAFPGSKRRHETRDKNLVRYTLLRNLGLDPESPQYLRWMPAYNVAVERIVREPTLLLDAARLKDLRDAVQSLLTLITDVTDKLEALDPGLSPYRSEWIRDQIAKGDCP
jgi:hypothetical protein